MQLPGEASLDLIWNLLQSNFHILFFQLSLNSIKIQGEKYVVLVFFIAQNFFPSKKYENQLYFLGLDSKSEEVSYPHTMNREIEYEYRGVWTWRRLTSAMGHLQIIRVIILQDWKRHILQIKVNDNAYLILEPHVLCNNVG